MEMCVDCLVQNGYELIAYDDEIHARFRKFIDGNEFVLLLIGPHSGNGYGYILRGDFLENHDRWSNADYEKEFTNETDFLSNWNRFWWYEDEE